MRVLHVTPSMDPAEGGPVNWILSCSRILNALGHESEAVTVDDPRSPFLQGLGMEVHATGPVKALKYAPRLKTWVAANEAGYDAIVTHAIWDYVSIGTFWATRSPSSKFFCFPHGMLDPWFNHAYPLKKAKKMLFWNWMVYPILRDSVWTFFTTEEERILARQSFRPYRCREKVISYGVPRPTFDPADAQRAFRSVCPEIGDRPYLLYLSRIHPKKGCDLLIRAFAEVHRDDRHVLVLAGPDQVGMRPGLEGLAKELGVADRIVWPGMLQGDAKWGAFQGAEAFVLPSHQENFGQVVAEAMAVGKPVLISDKVNIHREVSSSGSGIVRPDTLQGTIALLDGFRQSSGDERAEMGSRGRKCFEEKFEATKSAEDFLAALGDGLAQAKAGTLGPAV